MTLQERFWSKVSISSPDECWEWTGAKISTGYGHFRYGCKVKGAHQISWLLAKGYLPKKAVLHRCDNPPCVNPKHLWLGTNGDNNKDRDEKNRQSKGLNHRIASGRTKYTSKRSKFKGVSWNNQANKWHARIWLGAKYQHLGYFASEQEAHNTYRKVRDSL